MSVEPKIFLNFIAFQVAWFACVLGGANDLALAGTMVVVAVIGLHLALAQRPLPEALLIAEAAGILSGSLYHHFDSKESMVDEILSTFQEELFAAYDAVLASDDDARTKIERAVRLSFAAIDRHQHEVAIFQNDADYLLGYRSDRPTRCELPPYRGTAARG